MHLSFELDLHVPVENILADIFAQLEAAGYPLSRQALYPQNITLEEALALQVGDVLHYEVVLPTEIPGTSSLEIVAVVTQRSIEKHTADKEAIFQLMIRPDMIIPYGPIANAVEERDALASPVDAHACDVYLLDDKGRKHPEVHTQMMVLTLPQKGTLMRLPEDYFNDLMDRLKEKNDVFEELYVEQMSNLLDPGRLDRHGLVLTVAQVINSYGGSRSEIWLTAIK
ncbi:MAG: hypothetical protein IJV27_05760 [Prevotella sp.]|nr:hypothetical protein [Prevotella sp.]